MDRKKVAQIAINEAGDFLINKFSGKKKWRVKPDNTLVTAIDKQAEKIFLRIIRKHFPSDGILSEEVGEIAGRSEYRWIIDPLDGTHNFIAGLPMYGCLLALEKAGEVIFSLCNFPQLGELFMAEKNKGAFLNNRRLKVSNTKKLEQAILLTGGSINKSRRELISDIGKCARHGLRLRMLGSAPFSFTRVATGDVIIAIIRGGKPWDIAPVVLLVEEAGGTITEMKGRSWRLDTKSLIATNSIIHKEALKIFGF
ncbi:inositol monophosphatase [Candidatus Peregrinibacteria bacterium]|nr:inositol monophosphatase [Candidatus Peregrinibacteria bacterium]